MAGVCGVPPRDPSAHPLGWKFGVPGVIEIAPGFIVDSGKIPAEYKIAVRFFMLAMSRLREAEEFVASCDAVDNRSAGAPHNID